jgi:hypothetical protein
LACCRWRYPTLFPSPPEFYHDLLSGPLLGPCWLHQVMGSNLVTVVVAHPNVQMLFTGWLAGATFELSGICTVVCENVGPEDG